MASIVTKILCSTVGLLVNKARDSAAAKLKEGDVTDAKIRELVVRELTDVKTKLDGLSRKDLLSSYDFLQEGVDLLNVSLEKSKLEQKALVSEAQDDRGATMPTGVQSGILNEALELSQAMGKLKINADKEFESALERFKDARKAATHAFRIESLRIDDRMLAAKIRVVSEMLECLETPETAIPGCLSSLKKLHALPAVQEMFNVYLNKGVKSMLNKAQRVENVKSVMMINYVVFKYVLKFSVKYSSAYAWPTLELADRSFNPILHWQEISTRTSMGDELTQLPNILMLNEGIDPYCSAVNGHGDVIVGEYPDKIKIVKTGESKVVKLPELGDCTVIDQRIKGVAVDENNNVYVVRLRLESLTENSYLESYVLDVLDENYNVKQDSRRLEFLEATGCNIRIAINRNNNIIMIKGNDPQGYIFHYTGELKHKFERDSRYARSLGICGQDEIMIPSDDERAVEIYSEEGNRKSPIKLPEGHKVCRLAFHYVICKIIVLTYVEKKKSFFLLCYTEAGELETTTFFGKKIDSEFESPKLKSHPSGPVAVVREKSITFL